MAAGEKTEKATPKKREDARKKGQVARSMEVNGAAGLLAAVGVLIAFGPSIVDRLERSMTTLLSLISSPEVVDQRSIMTLLIDAGTQAALAAAPVAFACLVAGVAASVAQVGLKPALEGIKPDPQKINPANGFKRIFGKQAAFELVKTLLKVSAVGAIAALAVLPQLDELAALVGMPAAPLSAKLVSVVRDVALRCVAAYAVIAVIDFIYQKWKFEKDLRMDRKELEDELKQQSTPKEVKSAQRRRQMQAAQARMMDAVPTADVVVTNPTHYAVALAYDPREPAPRVVAKGMDLVALRIRSIAREAGVQVVEDPPLARALHANVDVGRHVPEELFVAVAGLLAYVYRIAGTRRRMAGA